MWEDDILARFWFGSHCLHPAYTQQVERGETKPEAEVKIASDPVYFYLKWNGIEQFPTVQHANEAKSEVLKRTKNLKNEPQKVFILWFLGLKTPSYLRQGVLN